MVSREERSLDYASLGRFRRRRRRNGGSGRRKIFVVPSGAAKRRSRGTSLLIAALALAACADPVTPIKAAPRGLARGASVGNLTIYNLTSASTDTVNALQSVLIAELQRCATGPARYDMVIRLDRAQARGSRPFTDGDIIAGAAILIDPATRETVARYHVEAAPGSAEGAVHLFSRRVCGAVFAN